MTHPYATQAYAQSLTHMGTAIAVPAWDSWAISRPLEDGLSDICGPYPLAVIASDADLSGGLETLQRSGAVSVTLALDDFHRPSLEQLHSHFDLVRPFKTHYLVDRVTADVRPSSHHRYEISRALKEVAVREIELAEYLQQWEEIYRNLVARHGLGRGVHDFPPAHFETLAAMAGVKCVGAFHDGSLVAAHLWVVQGDCVHSHLAASSEQGYALRAAYAVNDYSIQLFSGARVINLGGGAGAADDSADGLARFKRGFANATAHGYICGKILDPEAYVRLAKDVQDGAYFPIYRSPNRKPT